MAVRKGNSETQIWGGGDDDDDDDEIARIEDNEFHLIPKFS